MHQSLRKYDDLTVQSGALNSVSGFVLSALLHNEMHFLPAFLSHYRQLGVNTFVFVDDRSTDGTAEFLAGQSDVLVLKSARKYGDKIDQRDADALGLRHRRLELLWRMLLLEKFAPNQWSLHLDADEFLELPEGFSVQSFVRELARESGDFIWAAMIDMYPATLSDLDAMQSDKVIDLDKPWFFDGRRHLKLRGDKTPSTVHPGCRARLLAKFGLHRKTSKPERFLRRALRLPPARYNAIRKPVMLRWREGAVFQSAHSVSLLPSHRFLLPIRHYKFNGPIRERILRATTTGGNTNGGVEYQDMARLLEAMQDGPDAFTDNKSVRFSDFADFRDTGNADGFDQF